MVAKISRNENTTSFHLWTTKYICVRHWAKYSAYIFYLILTALWGTHYYLHLTDKELIPRKAKSLPRVTELHRFLVPAIPDSKIHYINHYSILPPVNLPLRTQMNLNPSHKRLLALYIHFYLEIRKYFLVKTSHNLELHFRIQCE